MAELMASEGHFVYAGTRKDKDMAELNAIENIQAIRLDVTDQAQIDAAVKTIESGGRGLYGLINNAGVGVIYPLITIRKAIEEVVQLNQGQEYSYTRDELVKMLEESMAGHP
jgi:NADP-dependent 3-hydroxy acid dehydrogenase YdfG